MGWLSRWTGGAPRGWGPAASPAVVPWRSLLPCPAMAASGITVKGRVLPGFHWGPLLSLAEQEQARVWQVSRLS